MTAPKLTIGRIVHYVAPGTPAGNLGHSPHRAAIVIDFDPADGNPILQVLNLLGNYNVRATEDQTGTLPDTWHWPEREG